MANLSARRRFAPGRGPSRAWLAIIGLGVLLPLLQLISPASAEASGKQVSIIFDDNTTVDPGQTIQEMRHLGAGVVRIVVHWSDIAPDSGSASRPKFNASDPAAYPAASWAPTDTAIRTAASDGVNVLITIAGHAPRWAFGPGAPSDPKGLLGAWKPSASEFGQFIRAVGTRYSGHYRGLPGVHAWELYNEPNFGQDLSPQSVGSVLTGADMYRALVAAGWSSLRASGHARDSILLGALSAHGQNRGQVFGESKPLQFIRELYCVDGKYRPFRGHAAAIRGCATRGFRAKNPGLFNARGFSIHPYPLGRDQTVPPNRTRTPDKDYATFVQLPNVAKTLDRSLAASGSHKHYNIWNTEYGYVSKPPRVDGVSLANQAYYLDWAEYISWKNPRVASFMQYELVDPDPTHGVVSCGGFASGLIFNPALTPTTPGCAPGGIGGAAKPALDAWRLPLYLPTTSTRRGRNLEVWGCVRPAAYAFRDTHQAQIGHIQFQATGSPLFKDVGTVALRSGSCYFDRRIKFPSSGTVRLAYFYPATDRALAPSLGLAYSDPLQPSVSRSISITVR